MKQKKQSTLSIENLIKWIKSSNPTIDEMRYLALKIKNKKIDRSGISDDEFFNVQEIVNTSLVNLESDCPTLSNLEHFDTFQEMDTETISKAEPEIDTSPLISEVNPCEIIHLPKEEKRELFESLRAQLSNR